MIGLTKTVTIAAIVHTIDNQIIETMDIEITYYSNNTGSPEFPQDF